MHIIGILIGLLLTYLVFKLSFWFFSLLFSAFKSQPKTNSKQAKEIRYDPDPIKGIFYWGDTKETETFDQVGVRVHDMVGHLVHENFKKFDEYIEESTQDKIQPVWPFFLTFNALHLASFFAFVHAKTSVPKELAHELIDSMVDAIVSRPMVGWSDEKWTDSARELMKELSIEYLTPFVSMLDKGDRSYSTEIATKPIKDLCSYFKLDNHDLSAINKNDFAQFISNQCNQTLSILESKLQLQWVSNTRLPN